MYFSAVTPWELGIEKALGQLALPGDLSAEPGRAGFVALDISVDHAELAPTLPPLHRDPFDRMLVAQAQLESLRLVTADESLNGDEVDVLDATV